MYTILFLSNFNFIFHFSFSHLYLMKILNFPIRYWHFIHFGRKETISSFRNRLSPLGPMRKLSNIPRLLHFLTVLTWICNRLATSPTVNKEFVSSFTPSEILSAEYSVIGLSISDYPFYAFKTLLPHKNTSSFYPIHNKDEDFTEYTTFVTHL